MITRSGLLSEQVLGAIFHAIGLNGLRVPATRKRDRAWTRKLLRLLPRLKQRSVQKWILFPAFRTLDSRDNPIILASHRPSSPLLTLYHAVLPDKALVC